MNNKNVSDGFEKGLGRINITLQVFIRRLVQAAPLISETFKKIFSDVTGFFTNIVDQFQLKIENTYK